MSELKAHRFITTDELFPEANAGVLYYEKSEADKVIAEKDAEIARLDDLAHAHNIELLRKENFITELNSDIADLRDDKKLTDAILDERNAEIAELKDKLRHYPIMVSIIESAKRDILRDSHEIRHSKYKRCLLMAKICQLRCDRYERYLASLAYHGLPTIQRCRVLKNHYDKWYSRWLAIAEKFKEAK